MFRTSVRLFAAVLTAAAISGTSAAVAAAGQPRSSTHGTEHLVLMGTSAKSSVSSVIATGLFTSGGSINLGSSNKEVKLADGTFRMHPKFGPSRPRFNKTTCLLTITGRGTYTLSHGTGKYAGISGSGHFTISVRQVNARKANGACSTSRALAFQGVITAHGPVTLAG